MSEIPADLLVGLLRRHFFSRVDRAAVQRANGKPQPVIVDDAGLDALLLTHVLGKRAPAAVARCVTKQSLSVTKGHFRIGSYTPALDGTTAWLCLDIDGPGHAEAVADPDGAARAIVARCKRYGLPVYLERSGGGKGWHVWALFAEPVAASTARKLACAIVPKDIPLASGGYADPSKQKGIEVFPKQDKIGKDGYGNLVWLPWWYGAKDGGNQFAKSASLAVPIGWLQIEPRGMAMPKNVSKADMARARGEVVSHRKTEIPPEKEPAHWFKPGNKFGYKHGAYSAAFVQPEEKEQFLALRIEIARDFKNETGPDTAMLDAAALLFMRHGRAVLSGEQDLANKTMASILAMLDRLKVTKVSREGDKPSHNETTPAEWASALLAKDEGAVPENAKKMADNSETVDPVTPENAGDSEDSEAQDDH